MYIYICIYICIYIYADVFIYILTYICIYGGKLDVYIYTIKHVQKDVENPWENQSYGPSKWSMISWMCLTAILALNIRNCLTTPFK